VGTRSQATSLRVPSLRVLSRKVVEQIEAPCSPDPIMRRPGADRGEKRVTHWRDAVPMARIQEQLDVTDPNQRGS
jgi:hypothetical protein